MQRSALRCGRPYDSVCPTRRSACDTSDDHFRHVVEGPESSRGRHPRHEQVSSRLPSRLVSGVSARIW